MTWHKRLQTPNGGAAQADPECDPACWAPTVLWHIASTRGSACVFSLLRHRLFLPAQWLGTSQCSISGQILDPWLYAHLQLAGKKLIIIRLGPPRPHWANLKCFLLSSCPQFSALPVFIRTFVSILLCAWLRSWASPALWRKNSKTEPDKTVVTLRFRAAV